MRHRSLCSALLCAAAASLDDGAGVPSAAAVEPTHPAERFALLRAADPASLTAADLVELGYRCAQECSDGAAMRPFTRAAELYLADNGSEHATRVIPVAEVPPEGIGEKDGPAFKAESFELAGSEPAPNLTSPDGGTAAEHVGTHDADGNLIVERDRTTGQPIRQQPDDQAAPPADAVRAAL
jgi:hypothetical protein